MSAERRAVIVAAAFNHKAPSVVKRAGIVDGAERRIVYHRPIIGSSSAILKATETASWCARMKS